MITLGSDHTLCAGGDACIFVSAFFFSLATVRLGKLASSFPTLRLAAAKSLVMALIAAGWLGTSALGQVRLGSQNPLHPNPLKRKP